MLQPHSIDVTTVDEETIEIEIVPDDDESNFITEVTENVMPIASVNECEAYYCHICLCHNDVNDSGCYQLSPCNHRFCIDCLHQYFVSNITDGRLYLHCFHPVDEDLHSDNIGNDVNSSSTDRRVCNSTIAYDTVKEVLLKANDHTLLSKYDRFLYSRENPNARECPKCDYQQIGDMDSPDHPVIICIDCKYQYCYEHGGAHENKTCSEYEKEIESILQLTSDYIEMESKPCPSCKAPICKASGCNHMKCPQCNQAFCWLCGEAIDDAVFSSHFQWWRNTKCSNLQMNEAINPSWYTRISAKVITTVELIIIGPITLASSVASLLVCFCFIPCLLNGIKRNHPDSTLWEQIKRLTANCFSCWGMMWIGFILLLPVGIIFLIVLTIIIVLYVLLSILLYPCFVYKRMNNNESVCPLDEIARYMQKLTLFCCCCQVTFRNTSATTVGSAAASPTTISCRENSYDALAAVV